MGFPISMQSQTPMLVQFPFIEGGHKAFTLTRESMLMGSSGSWFKEVKVTSPFIISPGVELEGLRMTSNLNAIRFQMLRDHLCFSFSLIEGLNSKRVSLLGLEGGSAQRNFANIARSLWEGIRSLGKLPRFMNSICFQRKGWFFTWQC